MKHEFKKGDIVRITLSTDPRCFPTGALCALLEKSDKCGCWRAAFEDGHIWGVGRGPGQEVCNMSTGNMFEFVEAAKGTES